MGRRSLAGQAMALAPAVNALAAAQGVTHAAEPFFRYGGADDPLFLKYRRVRAMGKGGADGAIFRAIVIAGALEGQIPALKYRNPGDDPQREIHQDPARKRAPKRSLAAAQGVPNRSEGQSYRLGFDRPGAAGSVRPCRASRDRPEGAPPPRPLLIRPTAVP